MFWIAAAFALSSHNHPPLPSTARGARAEVSARLVRGGEASKAAMARRNPRRIRTIIDRLPDGRDVTLVVFDFE
jgi:hypothetical protein